jgi:hypothetical protein
MTLLLAALLLMQPGPRLPAFDVAQASPERSRGALAPAETLIEPEVLRAIIAQAPLPEAGASVVGSDPSRDILLTCVEGQCGAAARAVRKLSALVAARTLGQPIRTIRVSSTASEANAQRATAVIHVAERNDRPPQILRGLWSTAGVSDEAAEIFGRHLIPTIEVRPYEKAGQFAFDGFAVSTTTVVVNPSMSNDSPASIVAATAYFLATLPNAGAEALLSHLTVGAHARLAEDGRKAVAQMGNQQRAGADVLIMFGQAIEREQRRMRSFERFMPAPVDPMLRSRIADMEKGITSVWTSMGITSSPFVPAAERIRGRGGEDRRVPAKAKPGSVIPVDPPTAFLKFENPDLIQDELANFIDGTRSISDIRDAVSAEFGALPLPSVVDYFERLAKSGAITLK